MLSNAQNFQMANPQRERLYLTDDSIYAFVEIDSIHIEGSDTIQYFNTLFDTIETSGCEAVYTIQSILGNKVIIKPDGTYHYFNSDGDTITFKTKAILSDEWRMYTYPNGNYINATLNSYDYLTVMPGVEDTLKGVKIRIYDSTGVLQTDSLLDGITIDFTKEFGLIQTPRFSNFPYDTTMYFLRGVSNPDTGLIDIKTKDVFHFLPGYEFHYHNSEITGDAGNFLQTDKFYKYFILSKTEYADSVTYETYRVEIDYINSNDTDFDTIQYLDTITFSVVYSDYAFLDTLELSLLQNENSGYSDLFSNDNYNGIIYKEVFDWFTYNTSTLCLDLVSEQYLPKQVYGDGIGTIYFKDSSDLYNEQELTLVYFQKGLTQWGEPLNFDSLGFVEVNNYEVSEMLNVYPVPAHNTLYVSSFTGVSENVLCRVFDANGQMRIHQFLHLPGEVDVTHLAVGFYVFQVAGDNINFSTTFIKE